MNVYTPFPLDSHYVACDSLPSITFPASKEVEVQFKLLSPNAKLPTQNKEGDAGWDVYSSEEAHLYVGCTRLINLDIASCFPPGWVALLWDRSGLAAKHSLLKLAGVIDSGYRNGWKVCLHNLGDSPYHIHVGDRIAQVLFQEVPKVKVVEVKELPTSERNLDGFGSSGK